MTFSTNNVSPKKNHMWHNQYSPCFSEGVAGRRPATPSHKHGLCPAFRVSTGLHFFWEGREIRNQSTRKIKNEQPAGRSLSDPATKPHSTGERETYLASTSTSAEEGVGPSDPNATRRSRRERANALAALQAKRQLQRHNHACRARLLVALGRPRTFALAKCRRKSWHSSDHLPPTSQAKTTKRERPNRPANSGYVASFLCLALARAAPFTVALRGHAELSLLSGLTMVVSTASWAPWNSGNPSATTSRRLLSKTPGMAMSRSLTKTFTETRPPASRQTRATALSSENPRRPNTPTVAHAVVAKGVERTATPARVHRKREGKPEATKQKHTCALGNKRRALLTRGLPETAAALSMAPKVLATPGS